MRKRIRGLLEKIYLLLICILFLLIVMTPYVITESLAVGQNLLITQQVFQSTVIACLLIFGYVIALLYRREIRRRAREVEVLKSDKSTLEGRMEEAFRYIGTVNIQMQQIRSAFAGLKEYSESHADFPSILLFVTRKVLGMVSSDFVIIRVVDPQGYKTLGEHMEVRVGREAEPQEVSNKQLVNAGELANFVVVQSGERTLTLRVFCIFRGHALSREQCSMIEVLLNELAILFVLFTSPYYRK